MKRFSLSYRLLLLLLLLALAVSLVPLLLLAPYDVPCADDFSYGAGAHNAYQGTHSFSAAVHAAGAVTAGMYEGWQGSFAAVFLMALQPAVFGERLYALTPWLMLGTLLAGTFCFCSSLFSRVFGLSRAFGGCVAALLALFSVQLVPSPVQSLYWYNGSVYYTFFYGLSLLCFALAIPTAQKGGAGRIALLCLLCALLGGGNYVTALNCCVLFAAVLLLSLLVKHPARKRLLLPFLFLLAALGLSAAAPGNAVRQSAMAQTPNALWAIGQSFVQGAKSGVHSFSLPVLGLLVVLVLLFRTAPLDSGFAFRLPGLVTLFSFCVYAALFTPTLYAQGGIGEGRVQSIVFYAYLLLLALNAFYWTGWLRRRPGTVPHPDGLQPLPLLLSGVVCLTCCAAFVLSGHGLTSLMAVGHLRSGDAAAYRSGAEARLAVLRNESIRDAELEPYPVTPYLLFFDDITDDADDWRNQAVSEYYNKDTVILK